MHVSVLLAALFASLVVGCARHDRHQVRQRIARATSDQDWTYEVSSDWGRVNPDYALCQTGTQQSPIPLDLRQGLSAHHRLDFSDIGGNTTGNFYNWGYGPAFTVHRENDNDLSSLPAVKFDNETVYVGGWHIHTPADHSVGNLKSKGEMHFVLYTADGHERAVLAFMIHPGSQDSVFFGQMPPMIGFNDTVTQKQTTLDLKRALAEVDNFDEFWTYKGSLTSPPCSEGIRWFIARSVLFIGVDQMRAILGASTYSARREQDVWQHEINV
ncbi:unnamed protein product [Penicillium glandicola]